MSGLWPHPPYAEDQPYAHTILAMHVLFRGFQSGALTGPIIGTARHLLLLRRSPSPSSTPPFMTTLLRSTGTGATIATGVLAVGLLARMWGREEIEWKDRSWRLLENKGQLEVDTWSVAGVGAGTIALVTSSWGKEAGWRVQVGSCGMGATVGLLGYMIWRHGIKGGKWEDEA